MRTVSFMKSKPTQPGEIDWQVITDIKETTRCDQMYSQHIQSFADDADQALRVLRCAISQHNADDVFEIAHYICQLASSVGAIHFMDLAGQLQERAWLEKLDSAGVILNKLQSELQTLDGHLRAPNL